MVRRATHRTHEESPASFTLPELSHSCCDEPHREAHQVVLGALPVKLLRILQYEDATVYTVLTINTELDDVTCADSWILCMET